MRKRPESLDVSASYQIGSQGHVESSSSASAGGEVWALRWNANSAPQVANTHRATARSNSTTTGSLATPGARASAERHGLRMRRAA